MSVDALIVRRDRLLKQLEEISLRIQELQKQINHGTRGGFQLSPRQQEVLHFIKGGQTNKEIGAHLGITPRTVKFHIAELLSKFKKCNRHELKLCD